jgi:hypothetical protein
VRGLLVECRLVDVVVMVVLVLVLRRRRVLAMLRGAELAGLRVVLRVVLPRGLVLPWRLLLMESLVSVVVQHLLSSRLYPWAIDAVLPGGATRAPRLVVPVAPSR